MASQEKRKNPTVPLVIDLDGTLIRSDSLHDAIAWTFFNRPLILLKAAWHLIRFGKARMKRILAETYPFDPKHLPYNEEVIELVRSARKDGTVTILSTAADHIIAQKISSHLGIFDEVHASEGSINNSGRNKATRLTIALGDFQYLGNSSDDFAVWKSAKRRLVVSSASKAVGRRKPHLTLEPVSVRNRNNFRSLFVQARIHQWAKNILLFVPIFLSHRISETDSWIKLLVSFIAFGFIASGVYILNDLSDLENDRKNKQKKYRPIAQGDIPAHFAALLTVFLFVVGIGLAHMVGGNFAQTIFVYLALTTIYSLWLKKALVLDVLLLASLYTIRIWAGAMAIQESVSFWILSFSIFLFTSLAFVKRFTELHQDPKGEQENLPGRGYAKVDEPIVLVSGVASAFASIAFLALYINSDAVALLYDQTQLLWFSVPVLLAWVLSIWFRANRGKVHHDPILFALRDKFSLVCFGALLLIFAYATGW